ncbi:MAG: SAM-dependent methyltransferase [Balneolaceae bacterium]
MSCLYLIPVPLGKERENRVLPEKVFQIVRSLPRFIVENVRHAESFLQWAGHPSKFHELTIRILNRKTPDHEVHGFLKLLEEGDTGLFTEAGMPGVADPGAPFVRLAHEAGHQVRPLSGPSSIVLALSASGLNGQSFTFHGYLPVQERERVSAIATLEQEAVKRQRTQIFMETPYRNDSMLKSLLEVCRPETWLCVASSLTLENEEVISRPVWKWLSEPLPSLQGRPAIFLVSAR